MQQGGAALKGLGLTTAVTSAGLSSRAHYSYDALTGALIGSHGAGPRAARLEAEAAAVGSAEAAVVAGSAAAGSAAAHKRNVHLPRQSLRALLYSRLRPGTVRWAHRFREARVVAGAEARVVAGAGVDAAAAASSAEVGGGARPENFVDVIVERRAERGGGGGVGGGGVAATAAVRARVVVGADGIRSAARAALRGERDDPFPLTSLGVIVILGIADAQAVAAEVAAAEAVSAAASAEAPEAAEAAAGEAAAGEAAAASDLFDASTVVEWVDGASRLYAMPFERDDTAPEGANAQTATMWQLSFRSDETTARQVSAPQALTR